jgi:hypothetical protein
VVAVFAVIEVDEVSFSVSPVIDVTVAPEAIDVEPIVGAEYVTAAAAHEGAPEDNVNTCPSVPLVSLDKVFVAEA